eukprot:3633941-Rhodomonas_salina.3
MGQDICPEQWVSIDASPGQQQTCMYDMRDLASGAKVTKVSVHFEIEDKKPQFQSVCARNAMKRINGPAEVGDRLSVWTKRPSTLNLNPKASDPSPAPQTLNRCGSAGGLCGKQLVGARSYARRPPRTATHAMPGTTLVPDIDPYDSARYAGDRDPYDNPFYARYNGCSGHIPIRRCTLC